MMGSEKTFQGLRNSKKNAALCSSEVWGIQRNSG
jgi:hypothetical protein